MKKNKAIFHLLFFMILVVISSVSVFAAEKYILIGDSYASQEYARQNFNTDVRETPITWVQNLKNYYLDVYMAVSDRGAGFYMKGVHNLNFGDLLESCSSSNDVTRILVGGGQLNDGRARWEYVTDTQIKSEMRRFNNIAKRKFPNATIIVAPFQWHYANNGNSLRQACVDFAYMHETYGKSLGWKVLSSTENVLKVGQARVKTYFYNDSCHPNKRGQWLITNAIVSALKNQGLDKKIDQVKAIRYSSTVKKNVFILAKGKTTKNSIQLSWDSVPGADYYEIYGGKCGQRFKQIVRNLHATSSNRLNLVKGTYYNYQIRAFNSKKNEIARSRKMYIATKGGAYTNVKSVSALSPIVVQRGAYAYLYQSSILEESGKKQKIYEEYTYEPSKTGIVTVKKGYVCGIYPGTCYVYVISQSGAYVKVPVTVK